MQFAPASFVLIVVCASAVDQQSASAVIANPIRKVVAILQGMQKRIEAEAKTEADLYDKFMCYCKSSGGDLSKSISDSETRLPQLESTIKEAIQRKRQLESEIKTHEAEKKAAKAALGDAQVIRDKDAAAFSKDKARNGAHIDALESAIAAVEHGISGSFLQTGAAQLLKQLVMNRDELFDADRQDILAFLSSGQGSTYVPKSGDVLSILRTLRDDISKELSKAKANEAAAIATYSDLVATKAKQISLSQAAIETKHKRAGSLAVDIVEQQDDSRNIQKQLAQDKHFMGDLDKTCDTKTKEWQDRQQTRSEELLALSDTVKLLSDDDALELFKRTLPSAGASLIQMSTDRVATTRRVLHSLEALKGSSHAVLMSPAALVRQSYRPQIDFITLALRGRSVGFSKVAKMIDDMVATVTAEQSDDDRKQEYCTKRAESSADKKRGLLHSLNDLDVSIDKSTSSLSMIIADIKVLTDGVEALDQSVADATEQRKSEHEDFTNLMASDAAAKELLQFATNRLNKFYRPKLYKPPDENSVSEADQIVDNMDGGVDSPAASFAQVAAHSHRHGDASPPPPSTFGTYSKKSDESGGVAAMISLLVKGLDKEMQEAQLAEKDAQSDYEQMLRDSAEKRKADTKSLTGKSSAKAELQADMDADKDEKVSTQQELMATDKYIVSLHSECDWLLQYYDVRREARQGEIDSLKKAKLILNGAEISLLQKNDLRRRNLRLR